MSRTNTSPRSLLVFAAGLHDSASIPKEFAGQPSTLSYQPSAISYSSAEANAKADQLTTLPSLNHPPQAGCVPITSGWHPVSPGRQAGGSIRVNKIAPERNVKPVSLFTFGYSLTTSICLSSTSLVTRSIAMPATP